MIVLFIVFVLDCSIIMYYCVSLMFGSLNYDVSRLLESFLKVERGEGYDCLWLCYLFFFNVYVLNKY